MCAECCCGCNLEQSLAATIDVSTFYRSPVSLREIPQKDGRLRLTIRGSCTPTAPDGESIADFGERREELRRAPTHLKVQRFDHFGAVGGGDRLPDVRVEVQHAG